MRKLYIGVCLVGLAVAAVPAMAGFVFQLRLPIPEMAAGADVIVLGKVTGIQKNFVAAAADRKTQKKEYFQVVEVHVEEALHGAKGMTSLKVGVPCGELALPRGKQYIPAVSWAVGQEACLFLKRHPTADFYVAGLQDFFGKQLTPTVQNPNYQKDLELTRRCVKLLGDEEAGLKSADATDRYIAAAMWIRKYRGPAAPAFGPPPKTKPKQEPIDAGQSKRILKALEEVDWKKAEEQAAVNPAELFRRLGLTAQDGWTFNPRKVNPLDKKALARANDELAAAARQWLRLHGDTYHIRRFVDEANERAGDKKDAKKAP